MADDERLREAGDPRTPPGRLRTIHRTAMGRVYSAVIGNPSLPLELLRQELLAEDSEVAQAAWHNPSVPVLLESEPRAPYEEAAYRELLRWHTWMGTRCQAPTGTLAELVGAWGSEHVELRSAWQADGHRCREFARHLAVLFGLPWPTP